MGNRPIKPHPEIIDRVFQLMEKENLSQTKLAKKMGITQQRVSEFLKTGKISEYYQELLCAAYPNYLEDWLKGRGNPAIATKEDLARQNFENSKPSEADMTDFFRVMDTQPDVLFKSLKDKLDSIRPEHRIEVLQILNKIVEPYTLIREWEC